MNSNAILGTLKELCALPGISGREERVREYIRDKAQPFADDIIEDTMGNLLVFKKGSRAPQKKIMLAAHMDEVGMIVTSVTDEGFLTFDFAGSVDRRVILGKRVFVGDSMIPGLIGIAPPHLSSAAEREAVPKLRELRIDIGAGDKNIAESLVKKGDFVVFDPSVTEFGGGFIKAKAIDDRIGCTILLELLKNGLPVDTWFAFTVQEEVGLRGANTAAFRIKPEIALVLEGTTAADLPSQKGADKVCVPGNGPVIPFMDGGSVYDRTLFDKLSKLAEKNGILWQTKTFISGATDAAMIQRSRAGAKVAAISAAVRYIHSPSCVACIADFELMYRLALLFLQTL